MRKVTSNLGKIRLYSSQNWAGQLIESKYFGPGGALQDGKSVYFDYYDGTPWCHEYSLTFKNVEEANEFVKWHQRERPYDVYEDHYFD